MRRRDQGRVWDGRGPLEVLPRGERVHHSRRGDAVPGFVLCVLDLPKVAGQRVVVDRAEPGPVAAAVGSPSRDLAALVVVIARERRGDDRDPAWWNPRGAVMVGADEAGANRVVARRREHARARAIGV